MRCAMARAWMSVCPPAANGTMMRIGLPGIGNCCACAATVSMKPTAAANAHTMRLRRMVPSQGSSGRSLARFGVPVRLLLARGSFDQRKSVDLRAGGLHDLGPFGALAVDELRRSPPASSATRPRRSRTASPSRRAARGCASSPPPSCRRSASACRPARTRHARRSPRSPGWCRRRSARRARSRCARCEETASARSRPAFTCGQASVMLSKARLMWPPVRLFMMSPEERNGTWVIVVPVLILNSSAARWIEVPAPDEP